MRLHGILAGRFLVAVSGLFRKAALLAGALLALTPVVEAQDSLPEPSIPPEQPDWNAPPPSRPPTAPGTLANSIRPDRPLPPPDASRPGVVSSIPRESAASMPSSPEDIPLSSPEEAGVPNPGNFFLPDFDAYGRSFFERQGLRFRIGPVHLRMSLAMGISHTDNVFGSSQDPVEDNIARITPTFLVGLGDFQSKQEDHLRLEYSPTLNYYQKLSTQDYISQNLAIGGRATFSRYATAADLTYVSSNSPSATQTGGQEYSTLNFLWDNTYYLGAKTFTRVSTAATLQESENNNNYQTYVINPQIGYEISPKTTVSFGPFAGIVNIDQGGSQTFQGLNVGVTYSNLRKLAFNGTFGVQARQFQTQNSDASTGPSKNIFTPVLDFTATWTPRLNTTIQLELVRNVQLSDLQRGLTYTNNSVSFNIAQKFWDRISLNLGVIYQKLEYDGQDRTDTYIAATPTLSYSFWKDQMTLSVFYTRQNRSSTLENNDFSVNSYGFQLTYNF